MVQSLLRARSAGPCRKDRGTGPHMPFSSALHACSLLELPCAAIATFDRLKAQNDADLQGHNA
jgi:hypothetical protein